MSDRMSFLNFLSDHVMRFLRGRVFVAEVQHHAPDSDRRLLEVACMGPSQRREERDQTQCVDHTDRMPKFMDLHSIRV